MIKRAAYEWQAAESKEWYPLSVDALRAKGEASQTEAGRDRIKEPPTAPAQATTPPVTWSALARWAAAYPRVRVVPADPRWLLQAARLLNAAQQQADELLQQAAEKCEALRTEAAEQAAQLRAQALEEGKAEGRRQGEQAAREELSDLFAAAERVSQAALRFREETVESSRQELVHLALAIAHKLVGDALADPGKVAAHALREALLRYRPSSQIITVRVNAKDLPFVEEHRDEFLRLCQGARQWRVVADEQVGEGGCLIETEQGIIDGRLESRLGLVQNAIQEVISSGQTAPDRDTTLDTPNPSRAAS